MGSLRQLVTSSELESYFGIAAGIADALRAVSVEERLAYFRGCGYGT